MTLGLLDAGVILRLVLGEYRKDNFSWDEVIKQYRFLMRRSQQRKALLNLEVRQLRDMGISPEEARAEAGKGFWQD